MMIGNQGGGLRKPLQPSRTGLSIQELKAMTALRMSQGSDVSSTESSQAKTSQQPATSYAPIAITNSRSRRQASRAAATLYVDQGEFSPNTPQQNQPPAMTRVTPSPPPLSASSIRVDKLQAHSLTVQELKELTRMRLAREAVGPSSNNTSTSTETDLDSEIHHMNVQGVNRKNSANSLLTTTTLESRESDREVCSHGQSRSGTISPVSDSFGDDNDLFNYNGLQSSSHLGQQVSGSASRRHPHISIPGYQPTHHNTSATRVVNFSPNNTRGLSPVHSSSQSMHAQATAQMALLMDHHRHDMRDPSRQTDENSYDSASISSDQASSMVYIRQQQRLEENKQAESLRRQRTQELEFSQKCMMLARQQQGTRERAQQPSFSFHENGDLSQHNMEDNNQNQNTGTAFPFDRADYATVSSDTQSGSGVRRRNESFQSSINLGYEGLTLNPTIDIQSDFMSDRGGEPYMPPPVLGMMRKQQAMAMNMAYQRDMGFGGVQFSSTDIPPPPPIMSPILMRSMSNDSMGCSSPSMRHKSALSIACPGPVRERTLSDVNSLAFQMAEACLDSNSNPSTPKFSHRSFSSSLSGSIGMISGGAGTDYLAQALRRMTSSDSVSSIGSSRDAMSSITPMGSGLSLSLSAPRGYGQVYPPEGPGAEAPCSISTGTLSLPTVTEAWALGLPGAQARTC